MSNNKLINKSNKDFLSKSPINFAQFSASANRENIKNRVLGTMTKSCSNTDLKDNLILAKKKEYRKNRVKLKERAGEILFVPNQKKQHRVCGCGKCRLDENFPVGVKYNATTGESSYTNIQYCGSTWLCPDCSYRISQERKKELLDAMIVAREKKLHVVMLTLTAPHYLGDDLRLLLKKMSKAKHSFWTNRNSRDYLADQFPVFGHITATEVKYSDNNGWHPHFHILLFLEREYEKEDLEIIQEDLYEFWAEKCLKADLGKPSKRNGLNLKTASNQEDTLADYVSKWGASDEMTQGHLKIGKKNRDSLTPWELLELSKMEASTKDKYGYLFSVYAKAFKGRRQLFWSKGLKKLLKVNVKTDEELANKEQEEDKDIIFDNVFFIEKQDWWTICFYRLRIELLEFIELDIKRNGIDTDFSAVRNFLKKLRRPCS